MLSVDGLLRCTAFIPLVLRVFLERIEQIILNLILLGPVEIRLRLDVHELLLRLLS